MSPIEISHEQNFQDVISHEPWKNLGEGRRGIKEEVGIVQLWDKLSASCTSVIVQLDS